MGLKRAPIHELSCEGGNGVDCGNGRDGNVVIVAVVPVVVAVPVVVVVPVVIGGWKKALEMGENNAS